jgi:hypothetical protein
VILHEEWPEVLDELFVADEFMLDASHDPSRLIIVLRDHGDPEVRVSAHPPDRQQLTDQRRLAMTRRV